MHIVADVLLLNDVHVELEDDDHDVISPLSFKVVMNKRMMFKRSEMMSLKMLEDLKLVSVMGKMRGPILLKKLSLMYM